ncbi:hypothetical protein C2G38_2117000 [Gigaspora rosea]|uniref:Cytochrome b5 heme-binding domain-containing protein n=1 Tax=Gigaspora rosea TaxID=44941 RepID=A0A397U6Z8_9GLOM|nr:hypothetical protein C2G38_2117000 [Gigaspora rosea]
MYNQVIVVGGGLSGLSAAHTVLERGENVLILDKNSFFNGNSTKATSGINGALTKSQIGDLAHPDLIKILTGNSASLLNDFRRNSKMFPGMTIAYALMEGIKEIVNNQTDRTRLIKKARVTKRGICQDGQTCKEYGPVILATGGYAADFTENPLLKKYRPDIYNLPTTNSEGDGHNMVIAIGGKATHMEKVQVHPTGLVDLNFEIEWHFKHYVGRGLMKKFSGEALAKEIGISASKLKATLDDYSDIASNKKKILLARKFFHNVPITINDQFHVALMSPVLHYIMSGIDINAESEVRDMQEQVIPGLFASGEIAGGVHGANRLGGSSLLGCVVYGRVAGDSASRYLFQNLSSATANCRLGQIARQLAPYQTIVSVDPTNQKQYNPSVQAPQASPSQAPAPEKKADAPTREKKEYTAEEVAKHNKENDCWVIVNGEVLNVTNFLPGKSTILIYAGKDATEEMKKFSFDLFQKYSPESSLKI